MDRCVLLAGFRTDDINPLIRLILRGFWAGRQGPTIPSPCELVVLLVATISIMTVAAKRRRDTVPAQRSRRKRHTTSYPEPLSRASLRRQDALVRR